MIKRYSMSLWTTENKLRRSTVINFGKYRGKSLKVICDLDRNYFFWLLTKTKLSYRKHSKKLSKLVYRNITVPGDYFNSYKGISMYPEDIEVRPSEEYTRYYLPTDDDNNSLWKWT